MCCDVLGEEEEKADEFDPDNPFARGCAWREEGQLPPAPKPRADGAKDVTLEMIQGRWSIDLKEGMESGIGVGRKKVADEGTAAVAQTQ